MHKQEASLFDLDKTLFSCSLALEYYFYLMKLGLLPSKTVTSFLVGYVKHYFFDLPLKELHSFIFKSVLCQKEQLIFIENIDSFLDIAFEKYLYYPAYERLQYARHMGYYTAIVTSSPDFLADAVAERLRVDTVFATRYAIDDAGKFKHIVQAVDGEEKAKFVAKLSLDLKIGQITAYSDSFHDIAFLESAGQGVAVNPDKKLKEHSMRRKWQII